MWYRDIVKFSQKGWEIISFWVEIYFNRIFYIQWIDQNVLQESINLPQWSIIGDWGVCRGCISVTKHRSSISVGRCIWKWGWNQGWGMITFNNGLSKHCFLNCRNDNCLLNWCDVCFFNDTRAKWEMFK